MSTLIPCDYWIGNHTVELGIPWITPESIHVLDQYIKPEMSVLEIGSGGSTIYFAERCKYVLSFENLWPWYLKIKEIAFHSYPNVELHFVKDISEIVAKLGSKKFDIALVDICDISILELCKLAYKMMVPGGILVLNNYSADYCTGLNEDDLFGHLKQKAYPDLHWVGSGTKIYQL